MKIDVILADDHPALLAGVRYTLESTRGIDVIGTAASSTELIDLLDDVTCDVLVTDFSMPNGEHRDGIALLSYLRRQWPDLKIVVLTMIDNPGIVREVAKLGVQSYIRKSDSLENLVMAVHAVFNHMIYFPGAASRSEESLRPFNGGAQNQVALSKREKEVVQMYVAGVSISEIAQRLNRAVQTVSTQKQMAMKKLGIARDAELFRYAWECGLIVDGRPRSDL
ncbi:MAG: response regulator transcription factor [Paraburkholderia sp.]|uniref:response regulator transcription factor n=1 Tax=Paraburkholderia sp. TaxID=1926495 RepID=UPI001221257F|nr:response regulator transcription factor [Paraburkholderia sp.]TAM01519.1 MAG: response regulator transcription factor [Paraburkholderia sp.]TAM28645.1 MAG: response regulator transcription factor [Paraburkholderia sp.]